MNPEMFATCAVETLRHIKSYLVGGLRYWLVKWDTTHHGDMGL